MSDGRTDGRDAVGFYFLSPDDRARAWEHLALYGNVVIRQRSDGACELVDPVDWLADFDETGGNGR